MDEREKVENILRNDSSAANSKWEVGNGTAENPFVISDAEAFHNIRENLSAFYKLAADIDFAGEKLVPIGSGTVPFKGGLDGDGHVLKNFTLDVADNFAGLFGFAQAAKFKNLSVENASILQMSENVYQGILAGCLNKCITENVNLSGITISGGGYTGGIAGTVSGGSFTECSVKGNISTDCTSGGAVGGLIGSMQDGIVRRCYVTGEVSGGKFYTGGLVGRAFGTNSKIDECFAAGNIIGWNVGGLVGFTSAAVSNSFVLGSVISITNEAGTGGLAGYAMSASIRNSYAACRVSPGGKGFVYADRNVITVTNSYFDRSLAAIKVSSVNNIGKRTHDMMVKDSYTGWDFNSIWDIEEGISYPFLRGMEKPDWQIVNSPLSGAGTEEEPYLICDEKGFGCIRFDLAGHYKLISDIDFHGKAVIPTGTVAVPFTGVFDGGGHILRNFKTETSDSCSGLFGKAIGAKFKDLVIERAEKQKSVLSADAGILAGYLEGCTAENIGIKDIRILGEKCVGALAGVISGGSLTGCFVKGSSVLSSTGSYASGGLVGEMSDCSIRSCFAEANVHGGTYTGGLAGRILGSSGKIIGSYAIGKVAGRQYAGGLAGHAIAEICDSFAAGSVISRTDYIYTGGLAGFLISGSIKNSYAACKVSARASGLVYADKNVTVTDSYFDSETAGTTASNAYNVGKLTSGLIKKESFAGWDFTGIWDIEEGHTYPFLRGMEKPDWQGVDKDGLPAGSGTEEDPYLIWEAEGLEYIYYDMSGYYKLMSDIDFYGEIRTPIGTKALPFTGGLDGNGYALRNFRISAVSSYAGLFGKASGAKFKNLTLENVKTAENIDIYYAGALAGFLQGCRTEDISLINIEISQAAAVGARVGALAGFVDKGSIMGCSVRGNSVITNTGKAGTGGLAGDVSYCVVGRCYAQAEVTGGDYTGGLIGKVSFISSNPSRIYECYASGTVTGNQYVGGLTGYTSAPVSDSFATGNVTSVTKNAYTGGLAGYADSASITNSYAACRVSTDARGLVLSVGKTTVTRSYYDRAAAGITIADGFNIGKLTSSLIRKDFYKGWDFTNIWGIEDGSSYPYLRSTGRPKWHEPDTGNFPKGAGTKENPYLIGDAAGLEFLKMDPVGYYKLMSDIDFGGETLAPIGTKNSELFSGGLDGDGHVLKNFKIGASASYAGLFGKAVGAEFKNLILENAETQQDLSVTYTGVLAGFLEGCTAENIKVIDVHISGALYVGGLAGFANKGSFVTCGINEKSVITSTGNRGAGGLAGYLTYCNVLRCHSGADIYGGDYTGGLIGLAVGNNNGQNQIRECHASGNVTGIQYVGGVVGYTSAVLSNCCAAGSVTSTANSVNTGGLTGYASSQSIANCYAACKVSTNAKGLANVNGNVKVTNSYFDSTVSGVTAPASQARTTEQMLHKETYIGWDWQNFWSMEENAYPYLKCFGDEAKPEPAVLSFRDLTDQSVVITWPAAEGADGYDICYGDRVKKLFFTRRFVSGPCLTQNRLSAKYSAEMEIKIERSVEQQVLIENLTPDTEYEFQMRPRIGSVNGGWSKILKIRTQKLVFVNGIHSNGKEGDSVSLMWNPVENAGSYDVIYNNRIQRTETNSCVLTGLTADTCYTIRILALTENGKKLMSGPIIERIFTPDPQTDYAAEFIEKCEGQSWFIDEIEKILSLQGKSVNTVGSREDFAFIYAIGLADRGLSGSIPAAIGEFRSLQYLYLANNHLSGSLPEELFSLEHLIEMDLSGNQFTD